jgi:hypothetical protein
MATRDTKRIGKQPQATKTAKGTYLTKDNWEVMKPFVHFSLKAMAVIGTALFAIVKFIPKALDHKEHKGDKIIKI